MTNRFAWSRGLPKSPRAIRPAIFVLLAAVFAAGAVAASDGWQSAPLYGADVRSLAWDPSQAGRVLAGTSAGQIYESLDGGRSWAPPGVRVALPGWVVSRLAFDPHHPGRVWAALWALWGSAGSVAVSDDGGFTWEDRGAALPDRQVYTLALAPDRADVVWAATRDGVWGSVDAGATWRHLTEELPRLGKVTSLLVDPYDPNILYAGSWRRAYRSRDRGETWNGIFDGMVLDSEVFSLVPGPGGEGDLWASTCGWVYNGRDRGGRWTRYTNGLTQRRVPSLAVLKGGRILAGTVEGVFGSDDRGRSWRRAGPRAAVTSIAPHPTDPTVVLYGSEGAGVWRSSDGGRSFTPSATGLVGLRVSSVVPAPDGIAVSVRDSEGLDGVHALRSGGTAPAGINELPEVLALARDRTELWAATEAGLWQLAGERWAKLDALSERRVLGVWAQDGLWAARSREAVAAGNAERTVTFEPGGIVRGVRLWRGEVWIASDEALFRWNLDHVARLDTPAPVRGLATDGSQLYARTAEGIFAFDGSVWSPLELGLRRLLETGDPQWPLLAVHYDGSVKLEASDRVEALPLEVPVPPREIAAALLVGESLHLATTGYGLLTAPLPSLPAETEAAEPVEASP